MRIDFDKVSVKATRRWRDELGRRRQETREFWQTINPYNRNSEGQPKTREEILAELYAEREAWLKETRGE